MRNETKDKNEAGMNPRIGNGTEIVNETGMKPTPEGIRVGKKLKGPICDQNRFYKPYTLKYMHIAYRIIPWVLSPRLFNCVKIYIMRYMKFTALTI